MERFRPVGELRLLRANGSLKSVDVTAVNRINAMPGDKVIIESSSLKVFSIAALVYILPLLFFLAAYFIADALKAGRVPAF